MVVAVGTRMPAWTETGFDEFARRMPRECALELIEIKAEARNSGKPAAVMMSQEAVRIENVLPARCYRVVLDEHGQDLTTHALSKKMEAWLAAGRDVAFIVGGPDGLDAAFKGRADEKIRLSSLTLPHAMVRPLLAEALYRAWSVLKNHPYHRE